MPADPRPASFPATRWTLIVRAGDAGSAGHRGALEDICRCYWFPLYAFARGRGTAPEDAEDQTQGFFAAVLQTSFFSDAHPGKGRLRSFLLGAFTHYLSNVRREAARLKRGGGIDLVSIDLALAEGRFHESVAAGAGLEERYEKDWALSLVAAALAALDKDCASRGRSAQFAALRVFLEGNDDAHSYECASAALGVAVNVARQEVYRLRQRYRDILRQTIADTLEDPAPEEIEAELEALKHALRR